MHDPDTLHHGHVTLKCVVTKLTAEEVRELFGQGQSKNPTFALEKGLIHEIRDVNIPDGTPLHSIVATGAQ